MSDSDKRVKDDLKALPHRRTLGESVLSRVGKRAWERPNVAISTRLYQYYDIQDPWDPNPHRGKWEAKLGPVSLRLGENKRQPARHLKPKDTKSATKKSSSPANQFKPKGIPKASKTKAPAPPPVPKSKPTSKLQSEFGGGPKGHKLFKMPMRPELAEQMQEEPTDSKSKPSLKADQSTSKKGGLTAKPKRSRPKIVSGEEAAQRSILKPKTPENEGKASRFSMKRSQASKSPIVKESKKTTTVQGLDEQQEIRRLPTKEPSLDSMFDSGSDEKPKRFSMRRKQTRTGPVVKEIKQSKPTIQDEGNSKPEPKPKPPPKPVDSFSLDDLFGAGGADNGPMRMKRRKPKPTPDSD